MADRKKKHQGADFIVQNKVKRPKLCLQVKESIMKKCGSKLIVN